MVLRIDKAHRLYNDKMRLNSRDDAEVRATNTRFSRFELRCPSITVATTVAKGQTTIQRAF